MNEVFPSKTIQMNTGCGKMYIQIIYDTDGKLKKIIVDLGKAGTCPKAHISSHVELLVPIFNHLPPHLISQALIGASGHMCQYGDKTCVNVLDRYLLSHILSELTEEKDA